MSRTPDMSKRQFEAALARHGMTPQPMPGYIAVTGSLPSDHGQTCVYRFNAGKRYRDQLAYLLSEQTRARQRFEKEREEKAARELQCREQDRQVALERGYSGDAADAFVEGAAYHRSGEWRAKEKLQKLNQAMSEALTKALT